MSWSLELRNGDLTISGARLGQTTGSNKLVQDLRCAILEPRGHDDMHPSFGSLIDGGIDEAGREVASIIGTDRWEFAALQIQSEIRRIAALHQARQTERAKADRLAYGESTLENAELLYQVSNIDMVQAQDRLLVTVTLQNGRGEQFSFDVPIDETVNLT